MDIFYFMFSLIWQIWDSVMNSLGVTTPFGFVSLGNVVLVCLIILIVIKFFWKGGNPE